MDNREFAKLLLCESTDLLESYGANGAGRKFYEERIKRDEKFIKDNKKKAEMYKRAGYEDKGLSKRVANAEKRIEENKYMADKYDTRQDKSEYNEYNNLTGFESKGEEAAQKSRWYVYAKADRDFAYADDDYSNATYSTGLRGVKSHKYNNRKLHKRINDRAEKAQNESIAILLTEAALLLNDED